MFFEVVVVVGEGVKVIGANVVVNVVYVVLVVELVVVVMRKVVVVVRAVSVAVHSAVIDRASIKVIDLVEVIREVLAKVGVHAVAFEISVVVIIGLAVELIRQL